MNVVTEKGTVTTSHLLIQEARAEDNGRYQCNPSNSQPKSINVHVLNGKRTIILVLQRHLHGIFENTDFGLYLILRTVFYYYGQCGEYPLLVDEHLTFLVNSSRFNETNVNFDEPI